MADWKLAADEGLLPPNDGSSFHFVPQAAQLADGTWEARYPGREWTVTDQSRERAIEKLIAEDQRRLSEDDGYIQSMFLIAGRHLREPIPGVYRIPPEVRAEAMASGDPEAVIDRYVADVDAEAEQGS